METDSLDMYSRLIKAFTMAAYNNSEYLDLVNFNPGIYRETFDYQAVLNIFQPAYGYGGPEGADELSPVIKSLEKSRVRQYKEWLRANYPHAASGILQGEIEDARLSAGSGVGTTGVMGLLLKSIFCLERDRIGEKPFVLLCLPNYSVYDGIVRAAGGESDYLLAQEENSFLPTPEQLQAAIHDRTLVFVITYPNNPAQMTFRGPEAVRLSRMVRFCQERRIHLIVDNVYQDTIWEENLLNPEIFALVDEPAYIYKVFGPSKDRPFFSGLRMGYYLGDARIAKLYRYYASLYTNTHNNYSSLLLAVDLLLRKKMMEGSRLDLEDCMLLDTFLAGWNRRIDPQMLLDKFLAADLLENYMENVRFNDKCQAVSLQEIVACMGNLSIVEKVLNGNIGNVVFSKINPEIFGGDCDELFDYTLKGPNLGILPGNVFGMARQKGAAWFRITTIHERAGRINQLLERMNEYFLMNSSGPPIGHQSPCRTLNDRKRR